MPAGDRRSWFGISIFCWSRLKQRKILQQPHVRDWTSDCPKHLVTNSAWNEPFKQIILSFSPRHVIFVFLQLIFLLPRFALTFFEWKPHYIFLSSAVIVSYPAPMPRCSLNLKWCRKSCLDFLMGTLLIDVCLTTESVRVVMDDIQLTILILFYRFGLLWGWRIQWNTK